MGRFNLVYKPFGNRAILVEWPQKINIEIQEDVWFFKTLIQDFNIKSIVEVISAYNSITIIYKSTIDNVYSEISALKSLYEGENTKVVSRAKLWEIPVCYHIDMAPDLESLSKTKNLTTDEIINLHTASFYSVCFIGFLPGFLYLSGLDDRLAIDRKTIPERRISKGAVAIGGSQTGIYPMESPGGWHIIGNSPLNFFNVKSQSPCFASVGDKIKFKAICKEEYHVVKSAVDNGDVFPKYSILND